jgi:DNA-binding IclR family transcriptional regulator
MAQLHETKEAILTSFRSRRHIAVADLAEEIDAHPAIIDRCCSGLQQSGYLTQTAPTVYTLTSAGELLLAEMEAD